MKRSALSPDDYLAQLPAQEQELLGQIRSALKEHLPAGFEETIAYGMIGYVVPHSLYPAGYHADPAQPLPFIALAAQKKHISLYHMGLYTDGELMNWFTEAYRRSTGSLPDMGKSCIRFKKTAAAPLGLIGELAEKITVEQWIKRYETQIKR